MGDVTVSDVQHPKDATRTSNVIYEKNGDPLTANIMGMEMSFSTLIGQKIVEEYISRLGEDEMNSIFDAITNEIFETKPWYNKGEYQGDKKVLKQSYKEAHGCWSEDKDTVLWKIIKNHFIDKYSEDVKEACLKKLDSDEYKAQVQKIADEIVDYATEGYKADMKQLIFQNLCGNATGTAPYYAGYKTLDQVINECIDRRLPHNY